MIKKFIALKNIGKFVNCNASGDVELRNLTLLYAENGRGKTTLCAVLRSLETGDPIYINERKTLGSTDEPEAQVLTDAGVSKFENGAWSTTFANIAVFDSTFIHENIYAGEHIDHEHKRNLHQVIVGKHGVMLARKVDTLDAESRDVSRDIRVKKAEVQALIPQGLSIEEFLPLEQDDNIDDAIAEKKIKLSALERSAEIKAKAPLSKLSLPTLPPNLDETLTTELEDVSKDAEAAIRKHITSHTNKAPETWLANGLDYVKEDECPFCGQSTNDLTLMQHYASYFGLSYHDLKQEIATLTQSIESSLSEATLLTISQAIEANNSLSDFWKQFIEFDAPTVSFDGEIREPLETLRKLALSYAQTKEAAPLEAITPGTDLADARENHMQAVALVAAYNTSVQTVNTAVSELKVNTGTENLNTAKKAVLLVEATKIRYQANAIQACKDLQDYLASKETIEQDKAQAKEDLNTYSNTIFGKYKARINELLELFNTGFRIGDINRSYHGGHPSSSYPIIINDTTIDVGDSTTRRGTPAFRSTLSAGDRSTLALAFFLAQLEQNPTLQSTVIVFDDPFTSLDRFRRTCTQQLICEKLGVAKQVILLSHDPHFLKLVWDNVPHTTVKTLQLSRAGKDAAVINEWDVEAETQSGYFQDHAALTAYFHHGTGQPRDVARKIRPLLEGFLRVRFPSQFLPNEWLGDLITKIRGADTSSPLAPLQGISLTELGNINDYSKKYHHEQNPAGADTEPIVDGELQSFVRRTLRFVGGY